MNANDANDTPTARYEIRIDAFEIDADADQHDDADLLNAAPAFLIALANDANVTFTNIAARSVSPDPSFAADIALTFDATPDDVRAYLDAYDAPDETIMPV